MLDEEAYRRARDKAGICPFEKAILCGCCRCSLAAKHNIAEREAVSCNFMPSLELCLKLHHLLREKALFSLKLTHLQEKLPHGKEMKIQCGGLVGLEKAISGLEEVADISILVSKAIHVFGELEALPYSEIVQSVSSFAIRQRHQ